MSILSFFSSNIPATAATFAAAITAAFASLKYYSDKAAKVTEFRKAWIESLRQAVAEFSGSAHTIAGFIAIRRKPETGRRSSDIPNGGDLRRLLNLFRFSEKKVTPLENELATELLTQWSSLRLSYNKIILHLNPSEHQAYTFAETAIAAYTFKLDPDELIRAEVSEFLQWCILLAQHRTEYFLKPKRHFWSCRIPLQPYYNNTSATVSGLGAAQKKIDDACTDAPSALLLAAFATRQLLHGKYENVVHNVHRIEHGIRIVDTSAAIVIKGVWEDIKRGEPAYRRTSNIAMILSVIFIGFILYALYTAPTTSLTHQNQQFECIAKNAITPLPGTRTAINPTMPGTVTFDCKTTLSK